MKLYDVPNNSLIKIRPVFKEKEIKEGESVYEEIKTPIASLSVSPNAYLNFHHIDGMYSLCTNMEGEVCHVAAWTEVDVVEWSYKNMALLRQVIKRGGHGKNGDEPVKWVPTSEMNDEWLDNCIKWEESNRPQNEMIEFYKWEQKYRKENGITVK